jgi:hypothetical protein
MVNPSKGLHCLLRSASGGTIQLGPNTFVKGRTRKVEAKPLRPHTPNEFASSMRLSHSTPLLKRRKSAQWVAWILWLLHFAHTRAPGSARLPLSKRPTFEKKESTIFQKSFHGHRKETKERSRQQTARPLLMGGYPIRDNPIGHPQLISIEIDEAFPTQIDARRS